MRVIDRIGQTHNHLTIISFSHKIKKGRNTTHYVNALCSCGEEKVIQLDSIIYNRTKSCGHLHKDNYTPHPNTEPNYPSEYNRWIKAIAVRKLEYSLTLEEFTHLITQNCYYCDQVPDQKMHFSHLFFKNGIDRINNDIGYHLDNSVSCCKMCNYMKSVTEFDVFLAHIEKISQHQAKKLE
jgi:hypothetical protein